MRSFKRRYKSRAAWSWADDRTISLVDPAAGTNSYTSTLILPPARVQWLAQQAKARSVRLRGILMWLNCYWHNPSMASQGVPNVNLYVMKTAEDYGGNADYQFNPYGQPLDPSAFTWASDATDGLDSFLWTHRVWSAGVHDYGGTIWTAGSGANVASNIASVSPGSSLGISRNVEASFRPNVIIKTNRRLAMNEGLIFGMGIQLGLGLGTTFNAELAFRVLTSR